MTNAILIICIIALIFMYWPLALGLAVILVILMILSASRQNRFMIEKFKTANIDEMSGEEFEYFIAQLLLYNGFSRSETTKSNGDHGVDVIATKDNVKYGIQCKRYSGNVGNSAVQEAFSGAKFYGCSRAVAVTNRRFTKQAKEEAKRLDVELWDQSDVKHMIARAVSRYNKSTRKERKRERVNKDVYVDDSVIITCPNCNIGVRVKKTNGKMLAIRCTNCNYSFFERT